jgi:hypothetical protein
MLSRGKFYAPAFNQLNHRKETAQAMTSGLLNFFGADEARATTPTSWTRSFPMDAGVSLGDLFGLTICSGVLSLFGFVHGYNSGYSWGSPW